jgi:hypothetical protein
VAGCCGASNISSGFENCVQFLKELSNCKLFSKGSAAQLVAYLVHSKFHVLYFPLSSSLIPFSGIGILFSNVA